MKSLCSMFITVSVIFNLVICQSWVSSLREVPDEAAYYCNLQNVTNEEKVTFDFNINEPNKNGTVDIEINYEPNCNYTLKVSVFDEPKDEETCKILTEDNPSIGEFHSIYSYNGKYELNDIIGLQTCSKKGIIQLKYIYKACYSFEFMTNCPNKELEVNAGAKYFDVPYEKSNFSNYTSEFVVQHRPTQSDATLEIQHPFLEQYPILYLRIRCNNCSEHYYGNFTISASLSETTGRMEYNKFHFRNDTNTSISCEFKEKNRLVCSIQRVYSGAYYFRYILKNLIRCNNIYYGIWKPCEREGTVVFHGPIELPIQTQSESNTLTWVLTGIASIVLIFAILYATYQIISRKLARDEEAVQDLTFLYPEKEGFAKQNKVLLLYPKDANIVMKTMGAFRNAIKYEGIEVYDIYDPEQQKIISEIDKKWISDKLIDTSMKIIIVQTYCGQIIENSSYSAEKLYKKPTCYDGLFFYALSLIRAREDPNSYTKLFIVHMGFDKMEYTQFSFLNPSTRYGLPQSFTKLIAELKPVKDCKINISHIESQNNNNNKLEEFIILQKEMKTVIEDPKYLGDILKVSVSYPTDKINIEDTAKREVDA